MQAVFPDNRNSVIKEPPDSQGAGFLGELVLSFVTAAEEIPAWGTRPAFRDKLLREFWPTEPILASALPSMVSKYSSLGWSLDGPPRTVKVIQDQLQYVEHGEGMQSLLSKTALDLFSQDNGAFIEIVRTADDQNAPCVTLNHLDAGRCVRTGRADEPVYYYDWEGRAHKLKYYQVAIMTEMPSPIEFMRGMQYSAVSRLLRAAQIMRDISIYYREKVSGRFTRAIHFISGISKTAVNDALEKSSEEANNLRLSRYIQPIIVSTLDPTSQVTKQTIEMTTLPDSFDYEVFMRWYINQLALAFATDYQEFAPLPAGNLGSSQQSQILHLKSKGKGPALFISKFERIMNFQGVIPRTVHFVMGEQDAEVDIQKAQLKAVRATERATRIQSGEITPEIARQIAMDEGDLREEYLLRLRETNLTPNDIVVPGSVPLRPVEQVPLGDPAPSTRLADPLPSDKVQG